MSNRSAILVTACLGLVVGFALGARGSVGGANDERSPSGQARPDYAAGLGHEHGSTVDKPTPRWVIRSAEGVTWDSSAPGYDAVVLTMLDVPVAEVYGAEVRDAAWAEPMERLVGAALVEDLEQGALDTPAIPGAEVTSVECRQSSCRASVEVPAAEADQALEALQFPPRGDVMSAVREPGSDGRVKVTLTFAIAADHRAVADYEAFMQGVRSKIAGRLDGGP